MTSLLFSSHIENCNSSQTASSCVHEVSVVLVSVLNTLPQQQQKNTEFICIIVQVHDDLHVFCVGVHACLLCVCVCLYLCVCVCGSRVSVWEELNTWTSITVMWATWDPTASLHHGHTAITSTAATESEGRGGRYGGGSRRQERDTDTHTHTRLYEEVTVQIHLGMGQTDTRRQKDLHVASALHDNSPLFPLIYFFFFSSSCQPCA